MPRHRYAGRTAHSITASFGSASTSVGAGATALVHHCPAGMTNPYAIPTSVPPAWAVAIVKPGLADIAARLLRNAATCSALSL